jgi:hypothetical protein
MFKVVANSGFPTIVPDREYVVYNVRDDSKGYPHFLIFTGIEWIWKSAKHFRPVVV